MASAFLAASTLLSAAGCLSSGGSGGKSGGLADLIPGHEEAALRKRVEADNFPSASQALHTSPGGDPGSSNRNRDGS
jgi:hypothetical protein